MVEQQEWSTDTLAKIKGVSYRVNVDTPISSTRRLITLPEAFDLHFYVRRPQALAIDTVEIHITVADAKGHRAEEALKIPVQYYQQKTTLIVPFRGHGIVGQDWITIGGHGGFHGGDLGAEFGVDLDGLDQKDGELSESNENASDAGWGRDIWRASSRDCDICTQRRTGQMHTRQRILVCTTLCLTRSWPLQVIAS